MVRRSGYAASATLAAIAALHVAWGRGSPFPFRDRDRLADAVIGSTEVPPSAACYAVAVALVAASALVADVPVGPARLRAIGRLGVAGVLGARGILGLLLSTELISPGSNSAEFQRLDRTIYAPLCLALSAASATAVRRTRST